MGKGIYSRGYLPHWDFAGSLQAITFRLADSVPAHVINDWRRELQHIRDDVAREAELHRRIARYEDAGHGDAVFLNPECASIIQAKIIAGHSGEYKLIDWCVMPNHVHVMCKLAEASTLAVVVRLWKGSSSVEINRLLGRGGALWQREYYDRYVRDLDHFHDCRAYIRNNPVKAGLCERPEDWRFSSAGAGWNGAPASAGEDGCSSLDENAG